MKTTGNVTTITSDDVEVATGVLRTVAATFTNTHAPEPTILYAAAELLHQHFERERKS